MYSSSMLSCPLKDSPLTFLKLYIELVEEYDLIGDTLSSAESNSIFFKYFPTIFFKPIYVYFIRPNRFVFTNVGFFKRLIKIYMYINPSSMF